MAQGSKKLKSKASQLAKNKVKQNKFKNQAAKSKRGTSAVAPPRNQNVQQQQKVVKALTKAINKKAEDELKARSFQADGKSFKMLGKVDAAKDASNASSSKKSKPQAMGKKKKKK